MNRTTAVTMQRSFYVVGLLIGVVVILYAAHVVLVPLALAVLLAFILTPPAGWLERLGLPRTPSVLVVALLALVLIAAAGYAISLELTDLGTTLHDNGKEYKANIAKKLSPVLGLLQSAQKMEDVGKEGLKNAPGLPQAQSKPPPVPVVVQTHGFGTLSWLPAVARPVLEVGGEAVLVVVLAIFVLLQRETVRDRMLGLFARHNMAAATRAMNDTAHRVSRYLLLQLCTNTVMGLCVGVGLYFIGVPYAVLWGILTAALRFIPYVGVWLSAVPPIGLGLAVFPGWLPVLLVLALYLALELTMSNAVEPLVFGHGTGVSPLPLLLAAVFWSWLWGPAGLLLSTPLTVCLVVLGRHIPALSFLDVLLAARPALEAPVRYYQRLLAGHLDEASALLCAQLNQQPLDAVCDQVVLPALVQARSERADGALSADEERRVLRGTRVLLGAALAPRAETNHVPDGAGAAVAAKAGPPPRVLGCAAQGSADALALQLLGLLLRMAGGELKLVAPRRVADEVQALTRDGRPAVVCIATLPPGGVAHAEHLCRRIHARAAAAKIVVGRWGRAEEVGHADERFRAAGAAAIGATLHETFEQVFAALGVPPPKTQDQPPAGAIRAGAPEAAAH